MSFFHPGLWSPCESTRQSPLSVPCAQLRGDAQCVFFEWICQHARLLETWSFMEPIRLPYCLVRETVYTISRISRPTSSLPPPLWNTCPFGCPGGYNSDFWNQVSKGTCTHPRRCIGCWIWVLEENIWYFILIFFLYLKVFIFVRIAVDFLFWVYYYNKHSSLKIYSKLFLCTFSFYFCMLQYTCNRSL